MVTWNDFPDVTGALLALTIHPSEIKSQLMCILQRLVVLLYDSASTKTTVNVAQKQMFVQKGRQFDNIPPTEAALLEHVKCTAYQAGHIWGQTLIPSPGLPSPQDWGWNFEDGMWKPFWTTQPEVMKSCQELISCRCQRGCRGRCSCTKMS